MKSKFLLPAIILIIFGLINLYSASFPIASENYHDGFYFVKRQLIWFLLAMIVFVIVFQTPLKFWQAVIPILFFSLIALLVVVKFTGLGVTRNGATRWISLGAFNIQPSELAKPILAIYLAKILSAPLFQQKTTVQNYLGVLVVCSTMLAVIAIQPDFGGSVLLAMVLGFVLFVSGAPISMMVALAGIGLVVGREIIASSPYKRGRLLAFLDPWADSKVYGFQLIQSYLALGNGGLLGKGAGLGSQKLFYLPEAHTDFVFSVIGEEWGFFGAVAVIAVIAWLLYEIFRLVERAQNNRFAYLLAFGVMVYFGGAFLINLGVTTGLLPTKGLALPLMSYGGSAMISCAISLGLLARIDREVSR